MIVSIALVVAGATVLAMGSKAAVRGTEAFARTWGFTPFLLGALLFGIDLDGLATALVASARGETALAAGGSFGTIVFVLSGALGLALVIAPRPVPSPSRPMVVWPGFALVAGAVTIFDLRVTRLEALALLGTYALYAAAVVRDRWLATSPVRRHHKAEGRAVLPTWALLTGGLAFVYLGATALVEGAVGILQRSSLQAGFVGGVLVGALTGADDVLVEVRAVQRRAPDPATGNVLRTLAAFSTLVPGVAALVRPLDVDAAGASALLAAAALYAVTGTVFLLRGQAGKVVGGAAVAIYLAWLALAAAI